MEFFFEIISSVFKGLVITIFAFVIGAGVGFYFEYQHGYARGVEDAKSEDSPVGLYRRCIIHHANPNPDLELAQMNQCRLLENTLEDALQKTEAYTGK